MFRTKLFKMKLKPSEILNLKNHRFVGTDNSILSKYVISYYTTWLVKKIPETIAPNLLTLFGLMMMIVSLCLTLLLDPRLDSAPKYLPLVNFLLMFMYFTSDNLDGAQARRTGSGSPLGQLLDHGVDSCCTLITSIALSSSLGFGISQRFIVLTLAITTQFYLVGLEEKFTGHFILGQISGASEGIVLVLVLHLVSFVYGIGPFRYLLSDEFLWLVKKAYCFLPRAEGLQATSAIIIVASILNVMMSLSSIRSKIHPSRNLSLYMTLVRILSLIGSFAMLHNTLRTESLGLQYLNILIFGQIFSIKYINEIYSYITKNDPLLFMPPYLMYLVTSIVLQLQAVKTYTSAFLGVFFLLSFAYYLISVTRIIGALTEALGISFMSISKPKKQIAGTKSSS